MKRILAFLAIPSIVLALGACAVDGPAPDPGESAGSGSVTATVQGSVVISLSGQASTLAPGSDMTVTATASASVDSYAWYLDGSLVAGQDSKTFTGGSALARGPHVLMVVAAKDGGLYSASHYFAVE